MKENYIYPFLWVSNNDKKVIIEEIHAIKASGANAFCVESRVHEDFAQERWWEIMEVILQEAKRLGMKIWVLDDKRFPTGNVGGRLVGSKLRALRIKADNVDISGRKGKIRILIRSDYDVEHESEVIFVFLVKMKGEKPISIRNVTQYVQGDFLEFDYDGSDGRLCVVMKTRDGWWLDNYIDMLNPESVNELIDFVYEPHYERFIKNGKYTDVFEGFFSDEPCFANGFSFAAFNVGVDSYHYKVGIPGMAYPWKDSLIKELWVQEKPEHLLSLWYDIDENTPKIRCAYMNAVTQEYQKNFCGKLSSWCHARGLKYAGHIIEDMGAHMRLGDSAGHYFRSQYGSDCASIDVVLHQIKPYYEKKHIAPIAGGYADPLFFNYSLAKLAVSEAAIDEKKQGRALCEIFGAYGFGEGMDEMLFLVNHMLVRGINMFIPHAFSPIYPNQDCPPHFYANGKNPAFEGYCLLGHYMAKMCEHFHGGNVYAPVAVLYDAEADWSGKKYISMDIIAKELMQKHIDFVFLPQDKLHLAKNYQALIIPWREYIPDDLCNELKLLMKETLVLQSENSISSVKKIVGFLAKKGFCTLNLIGDCKYIRTMRYDKDGKCYYFIHNETAESISFKIQSTYAMEAVDVLNEKTELCFPKAGHIELNMYAGQALLLKETCSEREEAPKRVFLHKVEYTSVGGDSHGKTYTAKMVLCENDEIVIEYEGELLTMTVGEKQFKRISQPAIIKPRCNGIFDASFHISGNLAMDSKDWLSKFSVMRILEIQDIKVFRCQ